MISRAALVLALALATGCSGGESPAAPTPAPSPSASPSPSPTPPPAPSPSPAPSTATPEQKLAALREARALARQGDFAGAWARLEPLVASDPGAPSFQCEAGFIAFRAGQTERAMPLVREAAERYPVPEDREGRVALARCLYNVGLVSEAAGDVPAALAAYQRSFSLRANRTVYEHLAAAALRADASSDAAQLAARSAIARRAIGPSASVDALAQGLTEFCSSGAYHPSPCTATVLQRWSAPAGAPGPLLEAAVIRAVSPASVYLAVRDASGARLVGSLASSSWGREPSIENARFEELVPPVGLEVSLDLVELADDPWYPGNDCDESEPGCMGASRRVAERVRVVCAQREGEIGCVRIPTMDILFHADGYGNAVPCDRPPPAPPAGRGWIGEATFDASGAVTVAATRVDEPGVQCPELDAPAENDAGWDEDALEPAPSPRTLTAVPFATLLADTEHPLPRHFPSVPEPRAPAALAHARPWTPPAESGAPPAPLDELVSSIAEAWTIELANSSPRCCPYSGSCRAEVEQRVRSGTEEIAVVHVTCPEADPFEEGGEQHVRVLTRGAPDGEHRAIATLQSSITEEGGTLPTLTGLRLEDALATPGLEVRAGFRWEVDAPSVDERTQVEVDARSVTEVEIVCTTLEGGTCHGLPVSYRGRQLAAGEDGRAAVVAATGYRVRADFQGGQVSYTPVEGTPPTELTGARGAPELGHVMPRWLETLPDCY